MIRSLWDSPAAVQSSGTPIGGGGLPSEEHVAGPVEFLDPGSPRDRAAWQALWDSWPDREIMAHPDYVRLFARPGDRVVAAVLQSGSGGILYPFILRPMATEPWGVSEGRACDLTTPYGYGGPFGWNVSGEEIRTFWAAFDAWARARQVVSSFDRLSLFPDQQIPFEGEVEVKGANIVRRLDLSDAELWGEYAHKVRQNVNHGRRLGLRVEADATGRRLDEFMEIYLSTMMRRNASSGYFHPRSFFESILRDLGGHFAFFHIDCDGKALSSELVLLSKRNAYSFLGGSLKLAFDLRANDLLKHEIITWCRNAGKEALVLGGGYRGSDGILAFKRSFAPNGETDFKVGKRIYDEARYRRLEEQRRSWEWERGGRWIPDPQHFPAYRA
jgi:hypothetical protein